MNFKHLLIVILLILNILLVILNYKFNKKEQFQYNYTKRDTKVRRCSEAISQLVNIVESLKAANLPQELAQELAMTIITEDPKNEEKVRAIISDLDITEEERRELNDIALRYKGLVLSMQHKYAITVADKISPTFDKYENDMLYYLNKNKNY